MSSFSKLASVGLTDTLMTCTCLYIEHFGEWVLGSKVGGPLALVHIGRWVGGQTSSTATNEDLSGCPQSPKLLLAHCQSVIHALLPCTTFSQAYFVISPICSTPYIPPPHVIFRPHQVVILFMNTKNSHLMTASKY